MAVRHVSITTDNTLLNTQTLTVTSSGDSVIPMKMMNGRLYFGGDIALDGEIRQWADLVVRDTFSYYMSDLANRDDVDWDALEELDVAISNKYGGNYTFYAFDGEYSNDGYYLDLDYIYYEDEDGYDHYHDYSFKRLATINEKGQLLPCKSDGIILLDRNSKETAFLEDAVVVLSIEYSWKLKVWPLTALTDYEMRFAMINDEYWDGYATQYERYDFVVNCEKAYAGCKFAPIAQRKYDYDYGYYYDEYDVKITTSEGSETVNVHNNDGNDVFSVVFGSTVTLEALTAPEGMMFDYWLKKENTDSEYGVPYYANPLQVMVANTNNVYFEARFKEIPPILVDGEDGDDQTGDGYDKPFKSITRALRLIEQVGDGSSYKIAALNYSGDIAVGSNVDGKASSIIIDFGDNNQENEGTTTAQHVIDINTTVPVTIANGTFTRLSADRVINVPAGKSLTFDNCVIWGGSASSLASVGGAYVGEGGKLTLKGSSIRYFYAENGGGVYVANGGNIEMDNNSYISNNEAENGGGIYIAGSSENLKLTNIENNSATYGGGIYIANGAVIDITNNDFNITSNSSGEQGGGIYVAGTLTFSNGRIGGYSNANHSPAGSGVYVKGSFTMSGGYIEYNSSNDVEAANGGGVYVNTGALFTMSGGYIENNKAANGCGVYLKAKSGSNVSTFNMNGGYIYNNTKIGESNAKGTGVYVGSGSAFSMSNSAQLSWYGTYDNVYLTTGTTINVSGDLSYNNVARIVPQTYQANTPVVTSGNINDFSKYVVEKQTIINTFGAKIDIEWTIDENGQLQKAATSGGNSIAGALDGKFKVSDKKTIQFSKGNLQYQASTNIWQFASKQTEIILPSANTAVSATNNGWIDLFSYGTSGWNSGANAYQPYSASNQAGDYFSGSLTGSNANADWGVYNAIINGGNTHGMWRTLTKDEWHYLFFERGTATESKRKFGIATIDMGQTNDPSRVFGIIILPDNWTMTTNELNAAGIKFIPGLNPTDNSSNIGYYVNSLTESQWNLMAENGAVFLPAYGYRYYDNINSTYKISNNTWYTNSQSETPGGYYWTASGTHMYFKTVEEPGLDFSTNQFFNRGMMVRLVRNVVDDGSSDTHTKIALNLPSGKMWAAVNLGSSIKPESNGNTTQYPTSYTQQFGSKIKWGATDLTSTADPDLSKTYYEGDVLELEDDAAYANWGGNWRVPTDEDWIELWQNCFWKCDGDNHTWKVYKTNDPYKKGAHRLTGDYYQEGDPTGYGNIALPYSSSIYYWTSVAVSNSSYAKAVIMEKNYNNNLPNITTYAYRTGEYYIRPVWVPITTTVFYVSPSGNDNSNDGTRNKPFATIQKAASKMIDKYTRYTIFVDGELDSDQELTGTIKARSITLRGAHGLDNSTGLPKDKINGGINVSTTVPLIVENLQIAGTVTVGSNAKVTLAGGALVNNVSVGGGTFTMKNDAKVTSEIEMSNAANVTLTGNATVTKATVGGTSTFTLKENAMANEVVLDSDRAITVDGSINTEGSAITVKFTSNDGYSEGRQVLIKSGIDNLPLNRFSLTQPDGAATPWIINSDGALHKLIGAIAPGEYLYIGYVVFPDGSASSYSDLTDEQKAQAVAVVFDNHDSENYYLAVSLEETQSKWATQESAMYNNYDDLHQYCGAVYDGSQNDLSGYTDYREEYYPAMWWAWHYSYNGVSDGWYLPAEQEMSYLFQSFNTVNNALNALGKTQLSDGDDGYWTSTMSTTNYIKFFNKARIDEGYVSGGGAYMHEKTKGVRPIRRFK